MVKSKFSFIDEEIEKLKHESRYNYIKVIESPQGAWLTIEGQAKLNLCSNNYLGLANHPEVVSFCIEGMKKYGVGPGAVRSIAGTHSLHIELERKISQFKEMEDTILLQSGFNANLAVIPTFLDSPDDAVISDELNHASIIDAIRLSKAKRFIYKHCDMDDLEEKLKQASGSRRKIVVTDGVFSMDGDIAPLPKIAELCQKYEAILVVDDAHGEGVLGRKGRGIVDHFGLHGKVDIEVGTLSKAFGVMGGFVSSNYKVIEFLKQKARPFLFSSSLTIPDTLAAIKAIDVVLNSNLVEKLWENTYYFKEEMRKLGFNLGVSETPITPVMLYEEAVTQEFARELFKENVFAVPIFYPTVPKNKARIRVMISAVHTKEDLDFALEKFYKVGKKLAVI